MTFREDESRIRKDHGPENFATLRRAALGLIKQDKSKGSVKKKRKRAGWNNDALLTIVQNAILRCGCPVDSPNRNTVEGTCC